MHMDKQIYLDVWIERQVDDFIDKKIGIYLFQIARLLSKQQTLKTSIKRFPYNSDSKISRKNVVFSQENSDTYKLGIFPKNS